MSNLVRASAFAVIGVLGAVCGFAGVLVSRMSTSVAGIPLPYGLLLAVVAAAALFREARHARGSAGVVAGAVGWAVPVLVGSWPRPEGDILVGGDAVGIGFVLLGILAAGWSLRRSRRDDDRP